jgi:hypothetical protein
MYVYIQIWHYTHDIYLHMFLYTTGRATIWNGDYHININLQMQYWASDTAGLGGTLPPLIEYLKRMRKSGELTAASLYDCKKGIFRYIYEYICIFRYKYI